MRKIFTFLFAALMSVGMWAIPENSCGDGLTWELNAGVLTISYDGVGTGAMDDYGYFEDTAPWGSSRESITSVIISDGVTRIGYYAFAGCSSLTSVTIGNSVTTIGYGAFYNCSSLTSVTIPNSVTSIEIGVFSGCSGLTSATIGNSVTSIGMGAFMGCSGLTSITIPSSVDSIDERAFAKCSNLETVTILAESLETYGIYAFDYTAATLKIYVPAGSVDTYKAGWAAYADKIEAIPAPAKERVIFGVNVPANGKPESIELVGSFIEGGWDNGIVLELNATTGWYISYEVYADADDEFKIRATGTWNNEIFVRTETGWTATQNIKFGDVWVDDTYKSDPVKWVELDLSGDNYGWKTIVQSIENIELTEQAKKVVVDGMVYIVRDGKLFNITGTQVR